MPITTDITATYRGPGRVVRRLLQAGQREDRVLMYLMVACLVIFIANWPALARQAHLEGTELNPLLGGSLMAWLFIAPLLFYVLAGLSHLLARAIGGQGIWYNGRLALFWALLAASPLVLLNGLVAGFIGPGPSLTLVGVIWCVVFLWFWISGLRAAYFRPD